MRAHAKIFARMTKVFLQRAHLHRVNISRNAYLADVIFTHHVRRARAHQRTKFLRADNATTTIIIVARKHPRARTHFVKWSRCFFDCALVITACSADRFAAALMRHPP